MKTRIIKLSVTGAALLLLFGLFAGVASAQNRTHTVQPGDNLTAIAARYNVSVAAIVAANGLQSPNRILVGQVLVIPPLGTQPSQISGNYTVQRGDNLRSIAARYNTTIEALATTNNISNPSRIFPGQVLRLPATGGPVISPPAARTPATPRQTVNGRYTVQAGDTLYAIGRSFNVDIWTIARANGILNLNRIFAGQVLVIPGR